MNWNELTPDEQKRVRASYDRHAWKYLTDQKYKRGPGFTNVPKGKKRVDILDLYILEFDNWREIPVQ